MRCGAKIRVSLRRSKLRREVLIYLVDIHPKKAYTAEISKEAELRSTDVCGALNGLSDRFKKERSLVNLGLVKRTKEGDHWFYWATETGCNVSKQMDI
ncbi:MAG: archaellum operon transcriptional activator EarA family protein [Euryarchaeota archaeon]|nr:archaellum operon transcriptional activator EarA family protein [Euryarchaeota archaeon]